MKTLFNSRERRTLVRLAWNARRKALGIRSSTSNQYSDGLDRGIFCGLRTALVMIPKEERA